MTKLQQKRLLFLDETCAHFNSLNRSVKINSDGFEFCIYAGVGCAIGRHIQNKKLCEKLDLSVSAGADDSSVFKKFPRNLRRLGQDFLIEIQRLHDRSENWDKQGLSFEGEEHRSSIVTRFGLV